MADSLTLKSPKAEVAVTGQWGAELSVLSKCSLLCNFVRTCVRASNITTDCISVPSAAKPNSQTFYVHNLKSINREQVTIIGINAFGNITTNEIAVRLLS